MTDENPHWSFTRGDPVWYFRPQNEFGDIHLCKAVVTHGGDRLISVNLLGNPAGNFDTFSTQLLNANPSTESRQLVHELAWDFDQVMQYAKYLGQRMIEKNLRRLEWNRKHAADGSNAARMLDVQIGGMGILVPYVHWNGVK